MSPDKAGDDGRLLVPLKEAAALLSMSYSRAKYLARAGDLRTVRNGARVLVSRRAMEDYIERVERGREAS